MPTLWRHKADPRESHVLPGSTPAHRAAQPGTGRQTPGATAGASRRLPLGQRIRHPLMIDLNAPAHRTALDPASMARPRPPARPRRPSFQAAESRTTRPMSHSDRDVATSDPREDLGYRVPQRRSHDSKPSRPVPAAADKLRSSCAWPRWPREPDGCEAGRRAAPGAAPRRDPHAGREAHPQRVRGPPRRARGGELLPAGITTQGVCKPSTKDRRPLGHPIENHRRSISKIKPWLADHGTVRHDHAGPSSRSGPRHTVPGP
ncbi:hypothetical protein BS35_006204 [Actinomadura glauciflava]|nr:hypothetical protein [Actinomadura glauciflava]